MKKKMKVIVVVDEGDVSVHDQFIRKNYSLT